MSKRADRGYSRGCRRFTTTTFPALIRSIMKRDWHGQEHFPPSGGMILAANHLSYVDWAAVALFTYQAGRYPAFLIKASMFDVKVVGPFLRGCGQFPVNRGGADAALVLREAERGIERGECVVIYPEGTATRDPAQWPMLARTGVARLALATGAPVIPLALWGAQAILPYGSSRPHLLPRRTVKMLAGPAVDLSAYMGQPLNREILRGTTNAIMGDIATLLAQLRGGTPPEVPFDWAAARRAAAESKQAGALAEDGAGTESTEAGGAPAAGPDGQAQKAAPA